MSRMTIRPSQTCHQAAQKMHQALTRISEHECRADRRHTGMVDVEEVEMLRRIARVVLSQIEGWGRT